MPPSGGEHLMLGLSRSAVHNVRAGGHTVSPARLRTQSRLCANAGSGASEVSGASANTPQTKARRMAKVRGWDMAGTSIGEHGQHAGVAVQVVAGDFTARKKTNQRHVAQRAANDLQLGARCAE